MSIKAEEIKWVDLSLIDVYMGSFRDASRGAGLAIVDMQNRFAKEIRSMGFTPAQGSFADGVYLKVGQNVSPNQLREAFGADNVKIIAGDRVAINQVFTSKVSEKTRMNSNAFFAQQRPLGYNVFGDLILESVAGRYFVRKAQNGEVSVFKEADLPNDPALFLRAVDRDTLQRVCDGFVGRIVLRKDKLSREHVTKLITASNDAGFTPRDYQEAIEAAMNRLLQSERRKFKASGLVNFDIANRLYVGMPELKERTANSVANQQYSTPLPLAVLAQAILARPEQLRGASVLEPTIGNANLVSTVAQDGADVFGVELDEDRVLEAEKVAKVVWHGDATMTDFRAAFGKPNGFDFVIANPPFGSLDAVQQVRTPAGSLIPELDTQRLDHLILLNSLHARATGGRAAFITGADNALEPGAIKGRSRFLLNYLFDHYHVEGIVDVSGELYKKQGAQYPVRLYVIGARKAVPTQEQVPETLPVIHTYAALRDWAEQLIRLQQPTVRATPAPTVLQRAVARTKPVEVPEEVKKPVEPVPSRAEVLQRQAEAFGKFLPGFYGVLPMDADLPDDFMTDNDPDMARAMGELVAQHGEAIAIQVDPTKATPFRVIKAMYEDGRGVGSAWAISPDAAYMMVAPAVPIMKMPDGLYYAGTPKTAGAGKSVAMAAAEVLQRLTADAAPDAARKAMIDAAMSGDNQASLIQSLERALRRIAENGKGVAKSEALKALKDIDTTELGSNAAIQALGVANVTYIGAENVYLEKDGKAYFFKPVESERYQVGLTDFSNIVVFPEAEIQPGASVAADQAEQTVPVAADAEAFTATHETPMGDRVALVNGEWVDSEGVVYEGDVYPLSDIAASDQPAAAVQGGPDISDVKTVLTELQPIEAPAGWIVMNAPRPLLGDQTVENGEFLDGRFYAAIDPASGMAEVYVRENIKLAASIVMTVPLEQQGAMAIKGSRYEAQYYEMPDDERARAVKPLIAKLQGRPYGELKTLLAEVEQAGKSPVVEPHYSEKILAELMASHGWTRAASGVQKTLAGDAVGGMLNPDGGRIVYGAFDSRGRYLTLQAGFEDIFDIDCRDRDVKQVAAEFDQRVSDWNAGLAAEKATSPAAVAVGEAVATAGKLAVSNSLPAGWTEASPGGMATNPDPENGGIVDTMIVSGKWFAVFSREGLAPLEGFETRAEAFAAHAKALHDLDHPAAVDTASPENDVRQNDAGQTLFGLSGAQIESMQGGKLKGKEQYPGRQLSQDQIEKNRARFEQFKAEEQAAVNEAARRDPRVQALIDGDVVPNQVLQAVREAAEGDESLIHDLARIHGIELPEKVSVESSVPSAAGVLESSVFIEHGTDAVTGLINDPGRLPQFAVARSESGDLFIVTFGRHYLLGGQPFTPGQRPEMSHEVQVRFDLSGRELYPELPKGPLYYTGLTYTGDWENVEKYVATPVVQKQAPAPTGDVAPSDAAELDYGGTRLYQTFVRVSGENSRVMWAVETAENKALRESGKRTIGGDSLHDSLEDAMKAADLQAERARADAEYEAAEQGKREIAQAKADAIKADTINGFLDGRPENVKALIRKALDKQYRFSDGAVMSVRERVESLIADGALEVETFEEPKIKDPSRAAFNRMDNREQDAFRRKQKEAGTKTVYLVSGSELGKYGYDYAQHMLAIEAKLQAEKAEDLRQESEFQQRYVAFSNTGEATTMIPANLSGPVYEALSRIKAEHGDIDEFVARELDYSVAQLGAYFSPEQVDAIAMIVHASKRDLGFLLADQMGVGKGRVLAAIARRERLHGRIPTFVTVKDNLFSDFLERDIAAIGSRDLFKNVLIVNNGSKTVNADGEVVVKSPSREEYRSFAEKGELPEGTDLVMLTYSQICRRPETHLTSRYMGWVADRYPLALLLDEAHNGAGASNTGNNLCNMIESLGSRGSVVYSSGTPIKGAKNLRLYKKILPKGVNPDELLEVVASDPLSLQEALNYEIAAQGCLISRELDNTNVDKTFVLSQHTERNRAVADQMAQILTAMSYMSGDVKSMVTKLNKQFQKQLEEMPEDLRKGNRMGASSMNFGSRLFQINRQFLLALKAVDVVDLAAAALAENRKPIIALQHTGESLLTDFVTKNSEAYDEVENRKDTELGTVVLSEPVTFKDLMRRYLERVQWIKIQGRYGDVSFKRAGEGDKELAEKMAVANAELSRMIEELPDDLPLTPIDYVRHRLGKIGYTVGEISGRGLQARYLDSGGIAIEAVPGRTDKTRVNRAVREFNNGDLDVLVLTESGSTGLSVQASPAVGKDTRPRRMIKWEMQPDIAKERQMDGRHNRTGQIEAPEYVIPMTGLPADDRLAMMFNNKNRSLTSSTVSNRDSRELIREVPDLLNVVGDEVAEELLKANPALAEHLDIEMPKEKDDELIKPPMWYISKLTGRISLLRVDEQESLYAELQSRFIERVDQLKAQGRNPLEVKCHDWQAEVVQREVYMGEEKTAADKGSAFNSPVYLTTLEYKVTMTAVRAEEVDRKIAANSMSDMFSVTNAFGPVIQYLVNQQPSLLAANLSKRYPTVQAALAAEESNEVKNTHAKIDWLLKNLPHVGPGAVFVENDLEGKPEPNVVLRVNPPTKQEGYTRLSDYVVFTIRPGSDQVEMRHLSSLFANGISFQKQPFEHQPVIRQMFDEAENGVVTRRVRLLDGNLFEAVSVNLRAKLGSKIVYTDKTGSRQHGILVHSGISDRKLMNVCERVRDPKVLLGLLREDVMLTTNRDGAVSGKEIRQDLLVRYENNRVVLKAPSSKSYGGDTYLDPVLSVIKGQEQKNRFGLSFSTSGDRMVSYVPSSVAEAVLQYLVENKGLDFYVRDREVLKKVREAVRGGVESVPEIA